jgi:hypothetical protein
MDAKNGGLGSSEGPAEQEPTTGEAETDGTGALAATIGAGAAGSGAGVRVSDRERDAAVVY